MDWNNITLKQFYQIQELLTEPDEYTALNIIDIIYDVDSANMTINQISKYSLEFLKSTIPTVQLSNTYTINEHEYQCNCNLTEVKTNQFIDYQNYMKEDKPRFENMLSVFFIPSGHNYHDGYDMQQVKTDMLSLPITVVQSAAFFFERQLQIFVSLFQHYLTQSVKKMKLNRQQKKQIISQLQSMDLANMVSFH